MNKSQEEKARDIMKEQGDYIHREGRYTEIEETPTPEKEEESHGRQA